jgi:hypothetical protein
MDNVLIVVDDLEGAKRPWLRTFWDIHVLKGDF